jgi:S-adenosylmethionine:tRNA ribosyltransferase-isomerase
MSFEQYLNQYDYNFPEELIAQAPSSPRDSAKLLVYDKIHHEISHDTFLHLDTYIPENAVLVFNQTKVVPARLTLKKPTGGKAIVLYIETVGSLIKVISDRKLEVGTTLTYDKHSFKITKQVERFYFLKPSFPIKNLFTFLENYGDTPIPPYIKHSPLSKTELKEKYQTVFAKQRGSVAAPTASLHFSKRLLAKLKKRSITIAYVTLHVNLGTFATLTEEQLKAEKLHSEWYEIDAKTKSILEKAKKQYRPIIAVGTTVVRTLESAANTKGLLSKPSGSTSLFIKPGYTFKFVDQVITNFHVPKSSLMMLVSAFIGREQLLSLYKIAIAKKYKLFSFGDGMYLK